MVGLVANVALIGTFVALSRRVKIVREGSTVRVGSSTLPSGSGELRVNEDAVSFADYLTDRMTAPGTGVAIYAVVNPRYHANGKPRWCAVEHSSGTSWYFDTVDDARTFEGLLRSAGGFLPTAAS